MNVTVLCGGVGAARFLRGLVQVVEPGKVTAIVNTGDDTVLHGLSISPDLDTIVYTLAGAIDPDRGWGLSGETWQAMEGLSRYAAVRPRESAAGATWFNLGDRDLATHLYRTARLGEGARATEVADEIRRAWDVEIGMLPMTDEGAATTIELGDGTTVTFQDYFVRLHHAVPVAAVHLTPGPPTPEVVIALETADAVVIAPSNPFVSVGPIRARDGVDELLAHRRDSVVAVSPIVGGAALKGPADRLMSELGHDPSVVGVARIYAPVAAALVIDPIDEPLASAVAETGMHPVITPSVMTDLTTAANLARTTIESANRF